ncbi:MAG: protein phosphatase 2C domain-containing protein [Muribaculaceae bacterium]|nr:protein phosphatase 2C domain-containing protein [Muribaculaceae bacterium]
MFYCCGITDTGSVRDHNEDAFLIQKTVMTCGVTETETSAPLIAAVADGVAGELSGEVASRKALEMLAGLKPSAKIDYLRKIMDIHRALQKYGVAHNTRNMQTTLCALAAEQGGKAMLINAGDSRMYLYRGGTIKQLSRDQSLVQMLYEQGHIAPEERRGHARKNVIFPVLGSLDEDPSPQICEIEGGFAHGDIVLLCTDGLSDSLTAGEMEEIFSLPKKLPKRLADMAERAIQNGSRDNVTAVAVTYLDE